LGQATWNLLAGQQTLHELDPAYLLAQLDKVAGLTHPEWLPELARLELACQQAMNTILPAPEKLDNLTINPSLQLLPVHWTHLLTLLTFAKKQDMERVEPGEEVILIWCDPSNRNLRFETALPDHLLALRMIREGIAPETAADLTNRTMAQIDALVWEAVRKGLLLAPESRLRRPPEITAQAPDKRFVAAEVFTLQWHLTSTGDLSRTHFTDHSLQTEFSFERVRPLMQELRHFCRSRFVQPQITFCGSNPLLHPRFFEIYQAAADHGLMTAIQGNPISREALERIMAIQRPSYYQVSLDGLEAHHDNIRGADSFKQTVEFLGMLTETGVPNQVMLPLTSGNLDQVLPLAELLEGITGGLTFNRQAFEREAASPDLPTPEAYQVFLQQYLDAMPSHPVLALKESLANIIYEKADHALFGGCSGFGCGAAFNFVAVLPDGEVHACHSFPSPIGTIISQSLEEIYHSDSAAGYRDGSTACSGCRLRTVCGGCLAISTSFGQAPLTSRDPHCFREQPA
jgi:selenobiotic family peptide radical SAM maturase